MLPEGNVPPFQEQYTQVLLKFAVANSRAVSSPLPPYSKLSGADFPTSDVDKALMAPCRSAFGSLMYLAVYTRPDISAVSSLSRFNANPGMAHWEGVQLLLRHLQGTSGEGICYKAGASTTVRGLNDVSQITCPNTVAPELVSSSCRQMGQSAGKASWWEMLCSLSVKALSMV